MALSERAERWLEDLPHHYASDPAARALLDACARELDRVEGALEGFRDRRFPQNADDANRLLGLWEFLLGLPVEPPGSAVSARRSRVLAAIRRRRVGAGQAWVEAITEAIGTTTWTHAENTPADYNLTLTVPAGTGSELAEQVEALAEQITPAHLDLIVTGGFGFQVGVSGVGDEM